jgi:hypothetical protein
MMADEYPCTIIERLRKGPNAPKAKGVDHAYQQLLVHHGSSDDYLNARNFLPSHGTKLISELLFVLDFLEPWKSDTMSHIW